MVRTLLAALAAACVGSTFAAKSLEGHNYTVNTESPYNQFGAEVSGLNDELPTGYDYRGYTQSKYVKRWSTQAGLPDGMLSFPPDMGQIMPLLQPYLMTMLYLLVPFLAFGILSTIYCCCWSCGMLQCCRRGGNRICCGKCCGQPMECTRGVVGVFLTFLVIATGAAVVFLGISALGVAKTQGDALELLPGSMTSMTDWSNNSFYAVDEVLSSYKELNETGAKFCGITLAYGAMQADFDAAVGNGSPDGLVEQLKSGYGDVESYQGILTIVGDVVGSIGGLFNSLATIEDERKLGFTVLWAVLCSLMGWEIFGAILRKLSPKHSSGCCFVTLFGFITIVYLFIMILVFIITTVLMAVTILLGDFCGDPDTTFKGLLGGVARERRDLSPGDMFGYFIDCDTNANNMNGAHPAMSNLQPALEGLNEGIVQINKANDMYSGDDYDNRYAAASPIEKGQLDADKATIAASVVDLTDDFNNVLLTLFAEGNHTAMNVVTDNFGQGVTTGVAKVVNCYQLNTRYNALVNMFCGTLFGTLAQTIEFLMAASILMVFIQLARRLARPADEDDHNGKESELDKEFNKTDTAFQGL